MSPIDDATLREHLARRATADAVAPTERDRIILGSRSIATERRRTIPWPWSLNSWIGASAASVAILLVLALVIPGSIRPPAAASVPPGSLTASESVPGATPTNQSISSPNAFTAQELSDMIGGDRVGDVVLANVRIAQMGTDPKRCPPPEACNDAVLADVSGHNIVAIGWRTAKEGEGTLYVDDAGGRWITRVLPTAESGLFAFRILTEAVEYLGPVVETADGEIVWNVGDVKTGEHEGLADDLYAVEGWLVHTPPVPCPAPRDYGPKTNMSYWCGGSFITGARVETYSSDRGVLLDPGGLHVQSGAYEAFAPTPVTDAQRGGEPRFGTYLVRSAGCQPVIAGECAVWSMVGRLHGSAPPVAIGDFPPEIDGERVLATDEARSKAVNAESTESFLVGGWVTVHVVDCAGGPNLPVSPLVEPCDGGYRIANEGSDSWGQFRLVGDQGVSVPLRQPIVLRVHVRDPRATACPETYRASCDAAIVVDEVVWPLSLPTPEPAPTGVVSDTATLAVGNSTTLRVFVYVNGMDATILDPGEVVDPIDPGMLPTLPWQVEATTASGRVILTLTVREGDVWHSGPDPSGVSAIHGAAARADLSCGRLDIWSGPPLGGPMPPSSFPPGDCDP